MSTDQEEQSEPHQAADERVHGVVADRASKNMRTDTRHAQRRDLKEPRALVEDSKRRREAAFHRRGGAAEATTYTRVPGLQVPAAQEDSQAGRPRPATSPQAARPQQQPTPRPARACRTAARPAGGRVPHSPRPAARVPDRCARFPRVRLPVHRHPRRHGPQLVVQHHGPAAAPRRLRSGPGCANRHGVVRDGFFLLRLALRVLVHAGRVGHVM